MHFPSSQWERIMNIQTVFTKAQHKQLTWKEAAEILHIDERTIRRWKQTVEESGFPALFDRRTRQPSPKKASCAIQTQVLQLYRQTYKDWNVKHFHEQLAKHGISYKYTWVKNLLQSASYVEVKHRKSKHRKKRERKPLVGMMLHIDGSDHPWIPHIAPKRQDLIVVMDDANSDVYYAKLVEEENTRECMLAWRCVVQYKGIFCSAYSDRASHFFHTPKAGGKVDLGNLTQIGLALHDLGVQMIPAYSPQARGRSERLFETWQGRLPNELKLHGIKTVPDANRYILESFLPWFKKSLTVTPSQNGSAFIPYRGQNLDMIFSIKESRTIGYDNTLHWNNRVIQIQPSQFRCSFAKCKVRVHEHMNGSITVVYGPHIIGKFNADGSPLTKTINPKPTSKQLISLT